MGKRTDPSPKRQAAPKLASSKFSISQQTRSVFWVERYSESITVHRAPAASVISNQLCERSEWELLISAVISVSQQHQQMQAVSQKMAGEKKQCVLLAKSFAFCPSRSLLRYGRFATSQGDTQNVPKPTQEQTAILSSPLLLNWEGVKPCAGTQSFKHHPLMCSHC